VYWLPTTGAAVEFNARHPAQAIIDLEATARYELGQPRNCNWGSFTPYFSAARLSSWLVTGKQAAAIEFQKFLLLNYPRLRLPILAWLAGMGSSEIAKKLAQNTRISFPHRKMAIPTSPYSRKPRRNTPNCSWAATSSAAFV
jgi:hypothetical protein